jgi:hypothetical protein
MMPSPDHMGLHLSPHEQKERPIAALSAGSAAAAQQLVSVMLPEAASDEQVELRMTPRELRERRRRTIRSCMVSGRAVGRVAFFCVFSSFASFSKRHYWYLVCYVFARGCFSLSFCCFFGVVVLSVCSTELSLSHCLSLIVSLAVSLSHCLSLSLSHCLSLPVSLSLTIVPKRLTMSVRR